MTNKPYISWIGHGAVSLSAPDVFAGAKAWVFAIDASTAAMQALADLLLNPVADGVVRYEPVGPIALLSFMDITRCTSVAEPLGWMPGREAAIWVPLIERKVGSMFGARLVLWAPYIFINYTIGLVTGREIWGWAKAAAHIGMPPDTATADFYCTTPLFRSFGPNTKGQAGVLYRVTGQKADPSPPAQWTSATDAVAGLLGSVGAGAAKLLMGTMDMQPTLSCVALKQVRSAADPSLACFQAVVESPIKLTAFTGGGLLAGPYQAEFTTCDSHRIVSDLLGQAPGPDKTTVNVRAAAWLGGDFTALPGRDIAVRT